MLTDEFLNFITGHTQYSDDNHLGKAGNSDYQ